MESNAPFIGCISKINNTFIDNTEDLDIAMPMYNLIEHSKNYSKTSESLWNYYRDEANTGAVGNINYSIRVSKSFDYKTNITAKLEDSNRGKEDVEIVVPLEYLSNFWRTLDIPLVNCEVSLILNWSEIYVLTSKAYRRAVPDADPAEAGINISTGATFKITDTLYVPVATLSTEINNELLQKLKTGFKRTVK